MTLTLKSPSKCSGGELAEFEGNLLAAGEPASPSLGERIRRAEVLAFLLDENGALHACGALRCPRPEHCAAVFRKALVPLPAERFTLDLGWFAGPEGALAVMVPALAERAGERPVMIISSTAETALHEVLEGVGFRREGTPYPSVRGDYQNIIYLRGA